MVEIFCPIFKRGMKGIYQHCGEQHLARHLVEFDFRYNHRIAAGFNDAERTLPPSRALKAVASLIGSLMKPVNWHQGEAQKRRKAQE